MGHMGKHAPSRSTRRTVYERDGGLCYYCRRPLTHPDETPRLLVGTLPEDFPTVDHVVSRYRGGSDEIDNMVLCCPACNREKSMGPIERPRHSPPTPVRGGPNGS